SRQVGHELGQQLEADQEGLKRLVRKLAPAAEDFVEKTALGLHVTPQHLASKLVLVLEVVEETALGYSRLGDDLVDRGGAESLGKNGSLGDLQDPLPRFHSPGFGHLPSGDLLHRQYSFPGTHFITGRRSRGEAPATL